LRLPAAGELTEHHQPYENEADIARGRASFPVDGGVSSGKAGFNAGPTLKFLTVKFGHRGLALKGISRAAASTSL